MKKIYLISLVIAAYLLPGCVDLDVSPSSSINKDDFYQTEEDAVSAVNGIYSILTKWPTGFYSLYGDFSIYLNDLSTDYVKAGANTNSQFIRELSSANVQPGNEFMNAGWEQHYIGINRANLVVDKLSTGNLPEALKNRLINEAKFLRGLFYYNIIRWWGDAPLILHDGEGEGAARDNVDVLYQQVVKDFEDATNLPDDFPGSTGGRATNGAAVAMLSHVYLNWAQTDSEQGKAKQSEFYQKAIDYANRSINSKKYYLFEDFRDNFDVTKKNTGELIFSAQHQQNDNTAGHCTFAMGWSDSEPVLIVSDTKFYDEIDNDDQRKGGSYAKILWQPSKGEFFTFKVPLFRKFIDTINFGANQFAGQNMNTVIIRFAEVYLIKAEAENELRGPTPEAYAAINIVRRRAYKHFPLEASSPHDLSGLTKDQFREKLQEERNLEFILEGQRWFDLVRWRKLVQTVKPYKPGVSLKSYKYPLPHDQIILNPNLKQNWGYDGTGGPNPYIGYEPGYE
ncbi:membrane protein [Bacteroidia bacterium]|nr:membrane protein [Bacteroidia bacterium]GHV04494.1 membrane protein [Bacteroidia bacterium]